jgi:hypothetical protein
MILRFASMVRRWSSAELSIAGRQIYIIDYDDGLFADGSPVERVLRSFLRTRSGCPLGLEDWSPAEKRAALEAVVTGQSRLGGIDVMDILQLRRFVVEIRAAESEEALDDLALRFMRQWHATNHLAYAHLRASASATVL